ncbi:MAG: ammonium transporter [Gammaproteobacteria bacterium]|nr:ammonium transporter [Gammaproteobacteria bacterium]
MNTSCASPHISRRVAFALVAILCARAGYADASDSGDSGWVMMSTALVLFMTLPGLSLFYGGMVRSVSVLSVLMQCLAIACLVTILWLVVGYSLAFGEGNLFIGDFSKVLFRGITADTLHGTVPEMSFALFQLGFAIITPALIVGGFAERMRFSSVLVFSGMWVLLVYAPIAHWVWGGGWLAQLGAMDFAGGTAVHIAAGTAAVVAAIVVGPRRGFPDHVQPPHNMTLTVAGAGMLWVGWFGFNGGSALAAGGDAAMAVAVTHIAAAAGAFTWMLIEWARYGKPSALGTVTGMVAGLGTVTAASGYIGPAGALVLGVVAGTVCFVATNVMNLKLKIDDSLDVFPVHAVGGCIGMMLTAVFASNALGVLGGSEDIVIAEQLRIQGLAVVAVLAYTVVGTWIILKITDLLLGNRVPENQEIDGLDIAEHNERGYII